MSPRDSTLQEILFVYGTLRRGQPAHWRLRNARALGQARTQPQWRLIDLGAYPALVAGGQQAILGECYALSYQQLGRLDAYEGVPRPYRRERHTLADGRSVWLYRWCLAVPPRYRARRRGDDWLTRHRRQDRPR